MPASPKLNQPASALGAALLGEIPAPVRGDMIKLRQYLSNNYSVHTGVEYSVADLETPSLWSAGTTMRRGDHVEVMTPTRWTNLIVWDAGPGYVAMRAIATLELPKQDDNEKVNVPLGFVVRKAVAEDCALGRYIAVRHDGVVMGAEQPLNTFRECVNWLCEHPSVKNSGSARLS